MTRITAASCENSCLLRPLRASITRIATQMIPETEKTDQVYQKDTQRPPKKAEPLQLVQFLLLLLQIVRQLFGISRPFFVEKQHSANWRLVVFKKGCLPSLPQLRLNQ